MKCFICKKRVERATTYNFLSKIDEKLRDVGKCCENRLVFDKCYNIIDIK
jgi:hypothetical protein